MNSQIKYHQRESLLQTIPKLSSKIAQNILDIKDYKHRKGVKDKNSRLFENVLANMNNFDWGEDLYQLLLIVICHILFFNFFLTWKGLYQVVGFNHRACRALGECSPRLLHSWSRSISILATLPVLRIIYQSCSPRSPPSAASSADTPYQKWIHVILPNRLDYTP